MDFTNRSARPQQPLGGPAGAESNSGGVKNTKGDKNGVVKRFRKHALLNVTYLGLLISVTIVIVGVLLALFLFEDKREDQFVDTSKNQAVFLNNGQVYFGKVTELNKGYVTLANIYYLRVNQQVQPGQQSQQASQNDVSLVKLGCELHGPQDVMVINREQVTFWENLKDDGQVSKAIAEYVKANPNGQDCSQPQQQQNSGSGNSSESNNSNGSNNNDSSNSEAGDGDTPASNN